MMQSIRALAVTIILGAGISPNRGLLGRQSGSPACPPHGPSHPYVTGSLSNLAVLYQALGAYDKADPLLTRAADIWEQQLRDVLGGLSDARKQDRMALLRGETDHLISSHADTAPSSATTLKLAFTTILRRKGRIVDSLIDNQSRLRAHLTPDLQGVFD